METLDFTEDYASDYDGDGSTDEQADLPVCRGVSYVPRGCSKVEVVLYLRESVQRSRVADHIIRGKIAALYDSGIPLDSLRPYTATIESLGRQVSFLPVQYGLKTLDTLRPIWDFLADVTPDVIVGVGGGSLCDLAGISASLYARGTPLVLFPTTFLAIVDASIGGKTGIDHGGVKNCFGTIFHPRLIIGALSTLRTLSDRDYLSGYAEVIKLAFLHDIILFGELERRVDKLKKRDVTATLRVLNRSILKKISLVESGTCRRSLLFGHNVGHALESLTSGNLPHGECVAIGMCVEAALAVKLGLLDFGDFDKLLRLLKSFKLPTKIQLKQLGNLREKMARYRLFVDDRFLFYVPPKLGQWDLHSDEATIRISSCDLEDALSEAVAEVEKHRAS